MALRDIIVPYYFVINYSYDEGHGVIRIEVAARHRETGRLLARQSAEAPLRVDPEVIVQTMRQSIINTINKNEVR